MWRFVAGLEPAVRFLAPGSVQLALAGPGDYVLWHEYRTVFEGRSFDLPAAMPDGARMRVDAPDGGSLKVNPFGAMSSEGSAGMSKSVAHFEAVAPGVHRVSVEGSFEPRVIAVAPNRVWPVLKLGGAVFALVVVAFGVALALGLYGFLRTVEPAAAASGAPEASLPKLVALVYGLQAASLVIGVTLFAGVIINYLRRRAAAGTWLESHFTWQIRTFWWWLLWCVVGLATLVFLVGFLVLLGAAVWLIYRLVRGWTELNEGRPMYR